MPETKRVTAEEARAKVAECRDMAKRARNPSHSTMLEHMAETWERIAKDIESVNGGE